MQRAETTTRADGSLSEALARVEGYLRGCQLLPFPRESSDLRHALAEALRGELESVVDEWVCTVAPAFSIPEAQHRQVRDWMRDAQRRWIRHIEDPQDVETYFYLRNHARGGFISQFPASRFLAGQTKCYGLFRNAIARRFCDDAERARDLLTLLDQEFHERVLLITDFFVEAKVEALHEQELSYSQSIDHAPAIIFRVDYDDGAIRGANRVAERTTGYSTSELLGKPFWDLHPREERERARQHWTATQRDLHRSSDDLHLVNRDGSRTPVMLNSGVIEYGRERFIQQICIDLSERKRLEGQLIQSEKMAAIGQLAAGVAHEIRNPLGAIRNALYDLRGLVADGCADAREDLRIAEEELLRAKEIIDNLLEFSRVSHREREPVDVNDVVERTLVLMNKYLEANRIDVVTKLDDVPFCLANENAIRQVVLNLLTNAVQAMPDGGSLRIETQRLEPNNGAPGRIALEVADSGIGIPDEHLTDIFNPFFTTKEPGQGTGLGLSVVDSIVRRSRGEIRVDSHVGHGSTFRVELPCDCPELEEPAG